MAIKLCGLSVMEPKLSSVSHSTFTGYDQGLQERGRPKKLRERSHFALDAVVGRGGILWHSPLDWSVVSALSKIARGLTGSKCVCAQREGGSG